LAFSPSSLKYFLAQVPRCSLSRIFHLLFFSTSLTPPHTHTHTYTSPYHHHHLSLKPTHHPRILCCNSAGNLVSLVALYPFRLSISVVRRCFGPPSWL
jgi:hypothetical protein